jgi:hypothetical protein
MTPAAQIEFNGSVQEQELARRIWEIMVGQGTLYARSAVIRQSLDNLVTFLAQQDNATSEELRPQVEAAIAANSDMFTREERDGIIIISTSRQGKQRPQGEQIRHTFAQRLYEPERTLPVEDMSNVVTMERSPLTTVEPMPISNYWRTLAGQPFTTPEPATAVEQTEVVEEAPETGEAATEEAAVEQPAEVTSPTTLVLSNGTAIDLRESVDALMQAHGEELQREVVTALDADPLRRIVHFGNTYYAAEALPSFGKNDLRRTRDYILEQGEPTSDLAILSDLYRERPGSSTFEVFRFGLNHRLGREKDFEFVGTAHEYLWSTKGLPALGTKRIKASDLGQLYSYLVEGYDDSEPITGELSHYLSVFEWEYGLLPLNQAFSSLVPQPLLPDQRTSVMRFEVPQHYTSYLVEVRYPTVARGGWIWGLDEFFREYVVPGTLITVAATDDPHVLTLSYEESSGVEERLLHFEEKRNRFVFMPVTYYALVDEDLLPSQQRYNRLRNLKPLAMNERKKPDNVIKHVFETVGEQLGTKDEPLYWIQLNELLLATNVLRPASRRYVEHVLSQDDVYYADEASEGAYYYKPEPVTGEDERDDETSDEDEE